MVNIDIVQFFSLVIAVNNSLIVLVKRLKTTQR